MRFAVVVYYAIFIYFGYAALGSRLKQRFFMDAMYYAIILSICHTLLGWMVPLREISPLINGVPLLGNYDQAPVYNILAVPYLLVFLPRLGVRKSLLLAVLAVVVNISGGGRAAQLGIIGSLVVVLWYRRILQKSLVKYIVPCGIIFIFLCAFIFTFFQESAIGTAIQRQGYLFKAIYSDSSHLPGKAGSKKHRIVMWQEIITETMRINPWLGQGFRDRLVDVKFYHPHNSFVTIFGRLGLLGLSISSVIYFGIAIEIARRIRAVKDNEFQRYLLFYLCFVPCCLAVGLTAPTFISPYSALVCNFIFGGALRLHRAVSQQNDDIMCLMSRGHVPQEVSHEHCMGA
jgi:O-antigen ligase